MPPKPGSSVGTGRQRSHVSIFDRRGQKPGRSRAQTGKNAGNTTSFNQGTGHRGNQGGHGDDAGAHGSTSLLFNKVCMLRFHEDTFSTSDLVVNASFFPGVRVGDIVSIKPLADGDEGDLTSPRGSFDNSDGMGATSANAAATASSAAAAAAAGAGATGMTSASAASGGAGSAAAAVPTAGGKAETSLATSSTHNADGAGAGSGAGTANGKPSSVRGMGADFKDPSSATRMADLAYRGSRRDFDDKYRLSAGIGGGGVPRSPNRWGGGKESERTLFSGNIDRTEDDESDVPFKPSPHREILLQVGEVRRDAQQLQASMLTNVARTLWGDYQTNQRVAIRKIDINNPAEREPICADFVEIAFRDQYVGRSDMWRLWRTLSKKIVHANKPTNMEGLIRASVRRIYKNNVQVPCGYIGSSTQAIFRSESGRFIIFIQMSEEMWAYQEDGNLCFEKAVNCFLAELFRRWNEKQLNHMVTIVMFSRWYYHVRDTLYFQDLVYDENAQRYYRDYYKVIADMEVRPDWTVFLPEILSEFNSYRRDIQELVFSAGHRLRGDLSTASQGNILEAINLGINSFASNHVDRDLSRTGLSTIVVTPSFGVFDVDKKLLRMTTERMLHLGLRVDLVCLAPKPLFRPPVFRFWSLPVPSVQEQRRALYRRRLARDNAEKAKATELNSVSPPAESPNSHVNSGGNVTFAVTSGSGISGGGGSGGPGSGGPSAALPKDRGAKAMAVPKPESLVAVDPIMLDPLYFDDENWENELMPYLLGSQPKAAGNASSSREQRLSAWQSGGSSASRLGSGDRLGGAKANENGASKVCSAVNALLDSMDSAMDNVPDTIKELSLEEYPFFSHGRPAMGIERRVIYCYFPYWMDCGFYNYTDERVSERPDTFRPCCKMGDLSINGASTYLQTKPTIPDIELRAMDAELMSLLGLETNVAPSIESPTLEATHRGRDEEGRSSDAPHVASMPKDSLHGRSVRLASVPEVETLLELFDKFDRRAIVGTGINAGSQPYDMAGVAGTVAGASDAVSQPPHSGMKGLATSVGEYRYASVTTPGILNNSHSSANPSTGNGFWDDFSAPSHTQHYVQQQSLQNRYADSRGGETQDAGLSTSAETVDRMTATVSTSVSPNITRGQSVKPPARSDHNPAFSASVPYEVKLNTSRPGANATNGASVHGNAQATGHTQTQAQAPIAVGAHQRTSVFMRNSSQRKRMQHQHQHQHQQHQQYQQQAPNHAGRADLAEASEPAETYSGQGQPRQEGYRAGSHSGPSPEMTVSMAAAAVSAAASAGSAKWRGAAPEYSVRPNMSRVSESPQSVHCEHIIHGSQERGTSDIMIAPNPPGERVGVSESMAKQSHLDDHIRTFKGTHGSQDATHQSQPYHHLQHQKQLQQTTAALIHPTSAAQRHSTMGGALLTGPDFQLTLPANRQSAGLFGHNSASISTGFRSIPSQPMAPVEYKGGSPQYCRTIWLSDRHSIVTHAPDQALRGPRGRTYSSYNPCNPELYPLPHTELSQRWALAFPTFWLLSSFTPKWRSLCTPASLPLVTDYSPTDLGNFYRRYNYDVKTPDIDMEYSVDMAAEDYDEFSQFMAIRTPSSAPVAAPIGVAAAAPLAAGSEHHPAPSLLPIDRSTRVMLKEMVYQRLAQGFQFINYGDSVNFMKGMRDVTSRIGSRGARLKMGNGRPGDPDRPGTRSGTDPYSGADAQHSGLLPGAGMSHKMGKTVWLSNGRQIQRLELQESNDPSHMPGVVVTRWERNKHFDQSDFRYRFQMWSRNNNMGYCPANIRFAYPRSEEVNWNNLDFMIFGHQPSSMKSTKYWRARYILIPVDQVGNDTIVNSKSNPQLSIEDIRIANFEKFLDHILRLLRKDERDSLEKRFLGALPDEMKRSSAVFNNQSASAWSHTKAHYDHSAHPRHKSVAGAAPAASGSGNSTTQQQQHQQHPPLMHASSTSAALDVNKTIGLGSITPSALMQIRYTTLYPVPYLINQLSCYMNDYTFLDPSRPIPLPAPAATVLGLPESLNVESPFSQLAFALQHPKAGIVLRNIRWHYCYYSSIFTGYQMVDWLLVNFGNVTKRSSAIAAGNRLMDRGLFFSVQNKGVFMDGHHFYAFTESALSHKGQQPLLMQQQQAAAAAAAAAAATVTAASTPASTSTSTAAPSAPPSRGMQSTLMSTIGFNDRNNRYSAGSNNPSPTTSRPASRQGSNAASVVNEEDSAASVSATPTGSAAAAGALGGSSKRVLQSRSSVSRESTHDSSSDSCIAGPQPSSKLRVRTDVVGHPGASGAAPVTSGNDSGSANSATNAADAHRNASKDKGGSQQRLQGQQQQPAPPPFNSRLSGYGRLADGSSAAAIGQASSSTIPSPMGTLGIEYCRSPEVFPKLASRQSRRSLPKSLHQSRMFALDLDQQRKSTRIENCLVHLDAVQNPMTCFHLSINWLNCTNYLIDELVRGWGRMAERCGMRLVEAPRAQDTTIEDSHPFHSPICIELTSLPPSADDIFDEEWVSEFAYFGDSDSEPETTDEEEDAADEANQALDWAFAEARATRRRYTRTIKRMRKCIPTYPFERELLEEHDFILDVEAEDNYPESKMLHREYTFERQAYEYTQYVHRSGTAFVQICGPGKFLWINNYLFTSHQNHLRSQQLSSHQQNLASASSQMSLGSYGAATGAGGGGGGSSSSIAATVGSGSGAVAVTPSIAAVASASDISVVSTPLSSNGRQTNRVSGHLQPHQHLQHSQHLQIQQQYEAPSSSSGSEAYPLMSPLSGGSGSRMVPAFYPMRRARGMWPHQVHRSLAMYKLPHRKLEIPEWYSMQVVDNLGTLPADFDSVNAAITRVAVMRQAEGPSPLGSTQIKGTPGSAEDDDRHLWSLDTPSHSHQDHQQAIGHVTSPKYNERRGEWAGESVTSPAIPVHASSESNPDILRANFIDICRDQNSLEMLWQQTICRYRNAWRSYHAGQAAGTDSPRSRPMVIDMFTEGMLRRKRAGEA